MPSPSRCDTGAVTAELALAIPAVLLVLAACLGGLRLGAERLRTADAAGIAARIAARGETAPVPAGGTVRRQDDVVCVDLRRTVPLLGLPVPVTASSCSLAGVVP